MKLLGISDIHGNVEAVRKLRARERNRFDAVVVAGDIGGAATPEIMGILVSFNCPVMYVFGNWDRRLPYDLAFGQTCHHLHLRSIECGGWAFAGFSGLPMSWGMNPIAAALVQEVKRKHVSASPDNAVYLNDLRRTGKDALRLNRMKLAEVIRRSSSGPNRTILVTHDRLFGIDRDLFGIPLHLFGHRHGFKLTTHRGTTFVNVSALDNPTSAGSYTVIEIDGDRVSASPFVL